MIRLHQKVNPERWYYHADKIGVAIFQDMVQKYGGATDQTIDYFVKVRISYDFHKDRIVISNNFGYRC